MTHQADIIEFSPHARSAPRQVVFDRTELQQILNIYGRKVAAGEWRDYALDFERDFACFSAFKRASEAPIYRIIKEPKLKTRQGAWRILGANGQTLKRGHSLTALLKLFDD